MIINILLVVVTIWAVVATILIFRNPLPFPDRGHRVFGVPDERAREFVVALIEELGPLRQRFTFDSGEVHQTLMSDGLTTIHYLEPEIQKARKLTGSGLSIPVKDPLASAQRAVEILRNAGYEASLIEGINYDLPPNHLVPVESDAFSGWAMVFRRPLYKMPFPKIRKPNRNGQNTV